MNGNEEVVSGTGTGARTGSLTRRLRRHSADAGLLLQQGANANAALKHTRSDPTPVTEAGAATAESTRRKGLNRIQSQGVVDLKALIAFAMTSASTAGSEAVDTLVDADAVRMKEMVREQEQERAARSRLAFADYLIKPVQRVCKYPLLFEQLARLPSLSNQSQAQTQSPRSPTSPTGLSPTRRAAFRLGGDEDEEEDSEGSGSGSEEEREGDERWYEAREEGDDLELARASDSASGSGSEDDKERKPAAARGDMVARALHAMRGVARAVDEAKRKRELELKSSLIVDRLVGGTPGAVNNGGLSSSQHQNQHQQQLHGHSRNTSTGSSASFFGTHGGSAVVYDEPGKIDGEEHARSELGHAGAGVRANSGPSSGTGARGEEMTKMPARSLSFSAAFARTKSRTRMGRSARVGSSVYAPSSSPPSFPAMPTCNGRSSPLPSSLGVTFEQGDQDSGNAYCAQPPQYISGPPSRAFLESLGVCLLAGSLDVVVRPAGAATTTTAATTHGGMSLGSSLGAGAGLACMPLPLASSMSMSRESESAAAASALGTSGRMPTSDSLASHQAAASSSASSASLSAPSFIPHAASGSARSGGGDLVKVKYLAAFLYAGGYVVLAKTPKAGAYEARHWFSLKDETVEVKDMKEGDGEFVWFFFSPAIVHAS